MAEVGMSISPRRSRLFAFYTCLSFCHSFSRSMREFRPFVQAVSPLQASTVPDCRTNLTDWYPAALTEQSQLWVGHKTPSVSVSPMDFYPNWSKETHAVGVGTCTKTFTVYTRYDSQPTLICENWSFWGNRACLKIALPMLQETAQTYMDQYLVFSQLSPRSDVVLNHVVHTPILGCKRASYHAHTACS